VEELIQAWTKLEVTHGYTLSIAGWGDDKYVSKLNTLAQATSNVQMLGPLYGQAKESALRDATYFILPSLSEGLPMAVLEALAAGCIPIITDECNLPDLFQKGVAERMRSDFSDFALRMPTILSRQETELSALSQTAWTESRQYDWQNIGRKMVERYHDGGVQNSDEVRQSPL
jgi:glycosyltransferase involved in cell wall biosynthesis